MVCLFETWKSPRTLKKKSWMAKNSIQTENYAPKLNKKLKSCIIMLDYMEDFSLKCELH